MHATISSGGRSPKKSNSHTSSQQLKACSDNIQNCGIPVSFQGKGRKRDRVEHGSELTKGELSSKVDDVDLGKFGLDMLKAEIAKITERGGLVNVEGVDKLLDLMQLDKGGRKMDLAGRVLLADVIASTSSHDCLGRFVQLEGVLMLADWLQEAHKGKSGDSSSPKYDDRSVEELLLALLRALDKLPINIHALQTSSIGKSVNNLRTHKIPEIQKKAKSLVDIWKKRVEDEMTKICDTRSDGPSKAVAWAGKPGFTDVCQGGVKHTQSLKNAALQPSTCKSNTAKLGHIDSFAKLTSSLPASSKSSSFGPSISITSNEMPSKTTGTSGAGDISVTAMKEEKSSGSSQSQNNSQSCSSDHGRNTGTSRREDARSSTPGSINASKISGNRSRHRKSINGYQKEANNGKSTSLNKSSTPAKVSQQVLERTSHFPIADYGNSHKLIVRLPNPGRSPSRYANHGNHEGISTGGSRASSPALYDRHDENDHKVLDGSCRSTPHSDACNRSPQGDGTKGAVGSNDGDRSSIHVDEEHRSIQENGEGEVLSEAVSSPSANGKGQRHCLTETNVERSHCPSFSSINALIESCVKCSESSLPFSAGDELGMNLLASVATGEIPKSDIVSPDASPMRNSPASEGPSVKDKTSLSSDEIAMPGPSQHDDNNIVDSDKRLGTCASVVESQSSAMQNLSGDRKSMEYEIEGKLNERSTDRIDSTHPSISDKKDENTEGESTLKIRKKREVIEMATNVTDNKRGKNQPPDESKSICTTRDKSTEAGMPPHNSVCNSLICEGDIGTAESCQIHMKDAIAESRLCSSLSGNIDQPDLVNEELNVTVASEKKQATVMDTGEALHPFTSLNSEVTEAMNPFVSSNSGQPNLSETNKEKGAILSCHSETNDDGRIEHANGNHPITNDEFPSIPVPVSTSCTGGPYGGELMHEEGSVVSKSEADCLSISCPKMDRSESDEAKKIASSTKDVSVCIFDAHVNAMKCDFDLNEGFTVDDGNQDGQADIASVQCSSPVSLSTLAPLTISPIPNCPSVPITVTAAAKGSFIPPENLLKSKAEPGWKGSAATSAFRPAEPRRVLELPLSISEAPTDVFVRQTRPPLEFDLNEPDERNLEDAASHNTVKETTSESGIHDISGQNVVGLDLDLNKTDEGVEVFPVSFSRRLQEHLVPGRPVIKASHKAESNFLRREFDLNNGPAFDETGVESVSENTQIKSSAASFLPSMGNLGMNNSELGNLSSWFAPGNSYQAVAVSPFLPERGSQPYPVIAAAPSQRIMASCAGGVSFGGDFYKGAVLSSSPAMTFTSAPFPYSSFPFNSTFSVPSASFAGASTAFVDSSLSGGTCFPSVSSQIASAANSSSSAYVRPYLISLPEGISNAGSGFSRSWGRQGLDLNAGPGNLDSEGRDERLPSSSQALAEQTRIYHTAGNAVKRKEPEGGWDAERFTYKRPSWQ